MISALEKMIQKGRQEERQKARQEGRQEARQEGRQEAIMKLVKAGFNKKKMEEILEAK